MYMYITYKKAEHIHITVTTTIKIILLYIATLAGIGVVVEVVSSGDLEIVRSVAFDAVMAVVTFEFWEGLVENVITSGVGVVVEIWWGMVELAPRPDFELVLWAKENIKAVVVLGFWEIVIGTGVVVNAWENVVLIWAVVVLAVSSTIEDSISIGVGVEVVIWATLDDIPPGVVVNAWENIVLIWAVVVLTVSSTVEDSIIIGVCVEVVVWATLDDIPPVSL